MADNKKYEGYDYKDFKSEEYLPTLIESIINKFGIPYESQTIGAASSKKTAHENINKLIEALDDSKFEKIARIGDSPYPGSAPPFVEGDFTDIYRILNPDSTINIQGISGTTGDTSGLTKEEKRVLASKISLEALIKQLKENPDNPSMNKNELAKALSSYPRAWTSDQYYLDESPREGFFINDYPVK